MGFRKVADLWEEVTASDSSEDDDNDANAVDDNDDESNGGELPQEREERTEVVQATDVRNRMEARTKAPGEAEGRGEERNAGAAGAETQHPSRKRKAKRQRGDRGNDNPYERHYPPPNQRSHRHRAAQRASARQQLRKDDGRSLRTLYTKILQSKDKLFIVRRPTEVTGALRWEVVQVDLDDTDPDRAQKLGEYSCKLYVPHQQDSETRPLFECRYWPEIRGVGDETSR